VFSSLEQSEGRLPASEGKGYLPPDGDGTAKWAMTIDTVVLPLAARSRSPPLALASAYVVFIDGLE
jgi:hypothetical protein